ncbi:MAG: LPS assembly protein LptD [Proteobacteria bacterium]|nr:LPS assembly protein LptD [Pseudomonadota bacterium]
MITAPILVFGKQPDYKSSSITQIDISAYSLEQDKEQNTYTARGKVELKEGTRLLNADYVTYNKNTQEIFAEGNVVLREGEDIVECNTLHLNLITKMGKIEKGKIFIKKGDFNITGTEIEKVGEATYTIKNGEMTTCEGDRPAWKFIAKDVDLTAEGYAKTKGAEFQILNQTVMYMPWGIFPVKTERQSGFLMPIVRLSSRDGAVIKNSYFWAISKDKDATFYLDYIANRGIKPGAEFRYALREDMKGEWYSSIIQDNDYGNTRYQIKGRHEQVIGKDMVFKINANHVSDYNYLKDFGLSVQERSENMVKSTAYVEKPLPKSLLTYEMSYFNDITQKNNDYTFKYLPFASFFTEYIPVIKETFYTDTRVDFTNFYREKGDAYSRLNFEPSLRLPFSSNGINFLINGTLYETAYLINAAEKNNKDTKLHQTAKIEANMNTQLFRNYHTEIFNLGEMQSLIKPQLKYTFIPNTSFTDIPLIDSSDRLYQTNTLTYSLNHYLNAFTPEGSREISLFEIEQTYGISGGLSPSTLYEGSGGRFSDISARLTLYPKNNLTYKNESILSTGGDGLKVMRNSLSHKIQDLYNISVTHNYTNQLTNELYYDLGGKYKYFEGKYQMRYSFMESTWIDTLYQITYRPNCWATTLTLIQSTRPRDTTVRLSFDLAGITTR